MLQHTNIFNIMLLTLYLHSMHDYSMATSNLIETSPINVYKNKKDCHESYKQTGLRSLYERLEKISFGNITKRTCTRTHSRS